MDNSVIVATTQEHLDLETIRDDMIILKNGICSIALSVSAINFGLLSEEEQDATIYSYAGLLNSLSFPIQIVIQSEKKDISVYLELLKTQESKLKTPLMKNRMQEYREFINTTITEQNVLDKKFYLIIPYTPITISGKTKITQDLIDRAKIDLEPKKDHIIKQLARIGLVSQALNSQNLIKLFHSFYNPAIKGQKFGSSQDYAQSLVAPNLAS